MAKQQRQGKKQQTANQSKTGSKGKATSNNKHIEFPLGRDNFYLMAIGFVIIIIGYILMSGDTNIYSFRKITLAPIVVMFGYILEIYAIMKTPKSAKEAQKEE